MRHYDKLEGWAWWLFVIAGLAALSAEGAWWVGQPIP